MYKFLLLITIITCATSQNSVNTNLINKNVERVIDLSSQLVKITATITIENTGKDAVQNFLIYLEPETSGSLSFMSAKDSLKDDLQIVKVKSAKEVIYNIRLNQALNSGRTAVVVVEYVLPKALTPYPSSITQKERQLVRYFGNHYFYSPYVTKKQTTTVNMNSRNIENHSKLKPVTQTDTSINYGPYMDIPALSEDTLTVHYENNAPFLTVTRLERLIEISHWGNIAVQENIEILHTGSKLKGSFSRYDYQRDTSSNHHSIKSYRTVLPAAAHSIYYRDSNGNISTSTVRPRKDWIELELKPRFPLFGGWKSSYTLGYSVPSYQYLFRNAQNEYVLRMRLLDHVFDDMHVEELETHIVLPVGVKNIKVNTPYFVERLQDSVAYKYLDSIGRSVVRIKKNNLVEQHIQDLEIIYDWQPLLLVHEPFLVSLALYILFLIVIIYVRLDFSIQEHPKNQ